MHCSHTEPIDSNVLLVLWICTNASLTLIKYWIRAGICLTATWSIPQWASGNNLVRLKCVPGHLITRAKYRCKQSLKCFAIRSKTHKNASHCSIRANLFWCILDSSVLWFTTLTAWLETAHTYKLQDFTATALHRNLCASVTSRIVDSTPVQQKLHLQQRPWILLLLHHS